MSIDQGEEHEFVILKRSGEGEKFKKDGQQSLQSLGNRTIHNPT